MKQQDPLALSQEATDIWELEYQKRVHMDLEEGRISRPRPHDRRRQPRLRLDSAELRPTSPNRNEVQPLDFRGDVQGEITGFIQPRISNPSSSALRLKLAASFRPAWLQRLGSMRVAAESFLNNGRLEGTLSGTLGRPRLQRAGGAR